MNPTFAISADSGFLPSAVASIPLYRGTRIVAAYTHAEPCRDPGTCRDHSRLPIARERNAKAGIRPKPDVEIDGVKSAGGLIGVACVRGPDHWAPAYVGAVNPIVAAGLWKALAGATVESAKR